MARITTAADQLVSALTAALAAAAPDPADRLAGAIATTDPGKAMAAAQNAGASLLVGPPVLEWSETLAGDRDVVWTIQAAAQAPAKGGPRAAWDVLDDLLDVVAGVVEVTRAVPGRVQVPGSSAELHAYVITTEPDTL